MTVDQLIPVRGCWVRRLPTDSPLGCVESDRLNGYQIELRVAWGTGAAEWLPLDGLRSGFQRDWYVQDVPNSATRRTLGEGRIVDARQLGGREQLLVQLDATGHSVWLPYEGLRRLKDVQLRYKQADPGTTEHAERFRLRLLAHALESWNFLTGSLDRLDVDPLPHQIQLVHRILSSGNYNWLIADDVGLGKTIEVGLLLAALKRKGQARRVLIVAPAGLTRQWQDEMEFKFDEIYEIYGHDFQIEKTQHWKLHEHVIISIDLAKREEHMAKLQAAGNWDVVVFDESHKLTRRADGERAQRYRLAEMLRPRSDAFLLLSGTPHQGYVDRFQALLELVRPDLRTEIQTLEANPEIVGVMIHRNRKSEVTDADGQLIFKGQLVKRVPIPPSAETLAFQDLLRRYLQRGYAAGATGGTAGRAIGFVMTTYRKLASSSIAAIEQALTRRLERLRGQFVLAQSQRVDADTSLEDLAEGGDEQDSLDETISRTTTEEFFQYEEQQIERLLASAREVRPHDEKLTLFLTGVAGPVFDGGKKLLVFTEYRATQSYLQEALRTRFPTAGEILAINGSMTLTEKLDVIEAFNEGPNRFLVSTEAGGEGLNLHRACHVLVNYDLPWNPARLVQRIGRLYRYGQKERVLVFNLHARDSFDNAAIDLMLQRVEQIVRNMATVGGEFNERLYADIVGDVLETLDFAAVLQSATSMALEQTREQIDAAIAAAQRAKQMQDEILSYAGGYDPAGLRGTLGLTMRHVDLFIRGMLGAVDVAIAEQSYDGAVLTLRLPDSMRGAFPEFGQRTVVRVTTDRRLAARIKDLVLLDFEAEFFQHLVQHAKSPAFAGQYASVRAPTGEEGVLGAFKLRWQNDQGEPLTEEFTTVFRTSEGEIQANPAFLSAMLERPLESVPPPNRPPEERSSAFDALLTEANRQLAAESTKFKHPNSLVQLAAADSAGAPNAAE